MCHVGGAEANVAVGLARLGHKTAMISRVPDNALGDAAAGHLRRYGVDTGGVATGPGRMGLYFLAPGAGPRPADIVYDREGSAFARAGPGDFDWDALLDGADLLHLSGVTPALGRRSADAALAAAEAARQKAIPISFDGNYRAQLWQRWDGDPAAILAGLVEKADILFGNHRDISLLLGRQFGGEGEGRRREAAEAAFEAFPRLKRIASTARHVTDADTHRIAARIDDREGSAQTDEVAVAGNRRPDRRGRCLRRRRPARHAQRARSRRDGRGRASARLLQAQPRRRREPVRPARHRRVPGRGARRPALAQEESSRRRPGSMNRRD